MGKYACVCERERGREREMLRNYHLKMMLNLKIIFKVTKKKAKL